MKKVEVKAEVQDADSLLNLSLNLNLVCLGLQAIGNFGNMSDVVTCWPRPMTGGAGVRYRRMT